MSPSELQVLVALLSALVNALGGDLEHWMALFGFNSRFDAETLGLLRTTYNDPDLRVTAERAVFGLNVSPFRTDDLNLPPGAFITPGSIPREDFRLSDVPKDVVQELTAPYDVVADAHEQPALGVHDDGLVPPVDESTVR